MEKFKMILHTICLTDDVYIVSIFAVRNSLVAIFQTFLKL